MLDHVTIRVSDLELSQRFYTTVLGEPSYSDEGFIEWQDFGIVETDADHPVTRHVHVAFAAPSRAGVDAFWRRGVDAGHPSDGEPGLRPQYDPGYYGGFLLDPDGNSVEAVHQAPRTESGPQIDHVWLGVVDLEASRRFYEKVASVLVLDVGEWDSPKSVYIAHGGRHVAFVADGRPPSEQVHFAFPVADDETVAAFHRAATSAGYRDNGSPGERPKYHVGYVGAFVLDPDGNNVEAVNHSR